MGHSLELDFMQTREVGMKQHRRFISFCQYVPWVLSSLQPLGNDQPQDDSPDCFRQFIHAPTTSNRSSGFKTGASICTPGVQGCVRFLFWFCIM